MVNGRIVIIIQLHKMNINKCKAAQTSLKRIIYASPQLFDIILL
jgi:hypothetical protein